MKSKPEHRHVQEIYSKITATCEPGRTHIKKQPLQKQKPALYSFKNLYKKKYHNKLTAHTENPISEQRAENV